MSENKIRPCPFCGTAPQNVISSSTGRIFAKVICHKCHIEICGWENSGVQIDRFMAMNDVVIEKWNTRFKEREEHE